MTDIQIYHSRLFAFALGKVHTPNYSVCSAAPRTHLTHTHTHNHKQTNKQRGRYSDSGLVSPSSRAASVLAEQLCQGHAGPVPDPALTDSSGELLGVSCPRITLVSFGSPEAHSTPPGSYYAAQQTTFK